MGSKKPGGEGTRIDVREKKRKGGRPEAETSGFRKAAVQGWR